MAQALWSGLSIFVGFVWGAYVFQEPIKAGGGHSQPALHGDWSKADVLRKSSYGRAYLACCYTVGRVVILNNPHARHGRDLSVFPKWHLCIFDLWDTSCAFSGRTA